MRHEQVGQGVDHICGIELPVDADHQRLLGEFIDDVEDAVGATVMRAVLDEVVGPDVVGMSQPL